MMPGRAIKWVVLSAVQPLLMEGLYHFGTDPLLVRFLSLAGAWLMVCFLIIACFSEYSLSKIWGVEEDKVDHRNSVFTVACVLGAAVWIFPFLVGVQYNWVYRSAGLILQVEIVGLWLFACMWISEIYILEWATKWVGLGMAGLLGLPSYISSQLVYPETPFWGTVANYDPAKETASAVNVATGDPWFSVKLMALSLGLTAVLTIGQLYRCSRKRLRLARINGG